MDVRKIFSGFKGVAMPPITFSDFGGILYHYNIAIYDELPVNTTTVTTFSQLGNLLYMYNNFN